MPHDAIGPPPTALLPVRGKNFSASLFFRHEPIRRRDCCASPFHAFAACRHGRHGDDFRRDVPAFLGGRRTAKVCLTSASAYAEVELAAVASRTGQRAEAYRSASRGRIFRVSQASASRLQSRSCCSTTLTWSALRRPDDRHFEAARAALDGGQTRLDREAFGSVAAGTGRTRAVSTGKGRAGEGRLSQAARPRPQEAADVRA